MYLRLFKVSKQMQHFPRSYGYICHVCTQTVTLSWEESTFQLAYSKGRTFERTIYVHGVSGASKIVTEC